MEIVVTLGNTLGIIWRLQYHKEITWGSYGDCSTTRRYPGHFIKIIVPLGDTLEIIWRLQNHQEIRGANRKILVPLGDTLGIIWRFYYNQETPCGLYGDCCTARRYLETTGILQYHQEIQWGLQYHQEIPWVLYGDYSTTRRYPWDHMEILVPLGDTLGIIWRCYYN